MNLSCNKSKLINQKINDNPKTLEQEDDMKAILKLHLMFL